MRAGVDVGGTFTDIVYIGRGGELRHGKVLTRPREPWRSVAEALESVGVPPGELETLVTATTLATNLFFGQTGLERPRVVLITNKGFEDLIEIGRQNRPSLYDPYFRKPEPLVPRHLRYGVAGRIDAEGREIEGLDLAAVRSIAARECRDRTVFAVVFLHSYLNPLHEREAAKAIREECPTAEVVTSSGVDPRPGEYERASTTLVNAILKPLLAGYLENLSRELRARGFRGRLLVMKSDGGLATPEEALRTPAAFIESGPAAGVVAAPALSQQLGVRVAVSFDMGGTTAKAGSVYEGRPSYTDLYEVGGKVHMGRIVRGSGYPVRYTFIDIVEVSSGGGTIAWVDRGGALRVGPVSAGADPGPACYGRGGVEPTVTDANAVLGRLPEELAGGAVKVRFDLARRVYEGLASKLGLGSPEEAAESVVSLANTIMARAVRLVTVERGLDPAEAVMVAFGGAGPLHAVEVAREVGVGEVVVPPYPGVFSALGLLLSDYKKIVVAPLGRLVEEVSEEEIDDAFGSLEQEAVEALEAMGADRRRVVVARMLEMGYRGQLEAIDVPYRGLSAARYAFESLYEARFGFRSPESPVEVSALKVEAVGLVDKPRIAARLSGGGEPVGVKRVYGGGEWVEAPVYMASRLEPGMKIEGPAVVVYPDSTLYVPPGFTGRVGSLGEVRVRV